MNQTFTCQYCNTPFIPKDTHKNREHPFCSRKCSASNFSSKHPRKTDKEYSDKHLSIPGNREKKKESSRKYSEKNKEKLRIKAGEYYLANKVEINRKQREYCDRNKERKKAYDLINKERIRKNHTEWCAKQRKENPIYRLHDNITSCLSRSLRTGKGGRRTSDILGFSMDALKKRLESRFSAGMTWENYGKWHVDHIIPISAYNFNTPDDIDFKRCWALSNLQPLWAVDNLKKGAKLTKHFQPSLLLKI